MKTQRECYEALIAGHTLIQTRTGIRVKFSDDGQFLTNLGVEFTSIDSGPRFSWPEEWSIYEEPKKPRVAEAWLTETGAVIYALPGSGASTAYAHKVNAYERCPTLDIVEKSE